MNWQSCQQSAFDLECDLKYTVGLWHSSLELKHSAVCIALAVCFMGQDILWLLDLHNPNGKQCK